MANFHYTGMSESCFKVPKHEMCSMHNLAPAKYLSDLITFVGEPTTPPDPLDLLSVNLYDQSDFVAVTWSNPFS